jgi:Fe-S cluster biogenesis protein NfuA
MVPEAAQEITERICGCQYHDGGSTRLVSASERDIHMQVEGACVFCPQIRYTIDILKQALRFRVPEVEDIVIDGTRLEERRSCRSTTSSRCPCWSRRRACRSPTSTTR